MLSSWFKWNVFAVFTLHSINSCNKWGQVTDNFFLRRCLLSGKLQSFLRNYSIFVILAACKVLLAFTKRYFFFGPSQLAFLFWANSSSFCIQNIFSTLSTDGVFLNKAHVANNVWIDLSHVFSRVTSECCRCTWAIWVWPPTDPVYHGGTKVVSLRPCKLQSLFIHRLEEKHVEIWTKSEYSLTWKDSRIGQAARVHQIKIERPFAGDKY